MSFFDLFLPSDKTAGKGQMAFDHPKVYNQLHDGPGPRVLSALSESVGRDIVGRLEAMDANLKRALKTSQGAWAGHAADSASSSTTPLSDAVQASRENSAEISKQISIQTEHFGKVKTMPPPKKVEPMDLGLAGSTLPGFLVEQADKEIQERQANEVEEAARQQYSTYQESTKSTTGSMPRYSPVPNPLTSVGAAETRPPGTIDPNTGDPGGGGGGVTGSTGGSGGGSGGSGIPGGGSGGSGGGGSDNVPQPDNHGPGQYEHVIMDDWGGPSDTESQSKTPAPPAPPGQTPPSGPTPSTTGGGGGGGGGIGILPGAGGAGGVSGGGGAARGSMSGRIGPGGSSGVGGPGSAAAGSAATSASGARGAGGGAMGGAGGRGRGGEEDEEHQRKYVEDSDEPFEFDGEVDEEGNVVAPPVIGQYRPPSHYQ